MVDQLEQHRAELGAHCRRIVGPVDAEDALQDTLLRALRGIDRFEHRASLRSWLYRIATNVCFDVLEARRRRAPPIDLGPESGTISDYLNMPDARWRPDGDPADIAEAHETVRLAFVAIQRLPPKQRAALILCEALRWRAVEVAELLDTSVAAISSALQRARATLRAMESSAEAPVVPDDVDPELLAGYIDAFERYDMDALTALIREDAM